MDLTVKQNTDIQQFNPEQTQEKIAQSEAAIGYGLSTGKIELVEIAVDRLCNERYDFLAWWSKQDKQHGQLGIRSDTQFTKLADYGLDKLQVSRWRKKHGTPEQSELTRDALKQKFRRIIDGTESVQGNKNIVDDWYTPSQYIEAARQAMGSIDLDPASSEYAQQTVKAKKYFIEGALEKKWCGNVWLNPPFSDVLGFADKLISHLETGEVPQAIVLTNNNTDTLWWHKLAELAIHICFTRGRISFYNHAGEAKGNTNGQTFFYFGDNGQQFIDAFYAHGLVLK